MPTVHKAGEHYLVQSGILLSRLCLSHLFLPVSEMKQTDYVIWTIVSNTPPPIMR